MISFIALTLSLHALVLFVIFAFLRDGLFKLKKITFVLFALVPYYAMAYMIVFFLLLVGEDFIKKGLPFLWEETKRILKHFKELK